ncbi:MAG: nucleoside kinase [bacterium]
MSKLKFNLQGKEIKISAPATPFEILEKSSGTKNNPGNPIMGAAYNNHMISMHHPLKEDGKLDFIRYLDRYGKQFYSRGMSLILGLAVDRLFDKDSLQIGHSIEHGYYYQLKQESPVNRETLNNIDKEMHNIIDKNLPIKVVIVDHNKALEIFKKNNQLDKVKLLEYWEREEIELHQLDDYTDFAYFPAPAYTGELKNFELRPYTPGFILRFPTEENPTEIPEAIDQPKLFQIYRETKDWAKILEVDNVGALNEIIEKKNISEFIKISEALHEKKISQIADEIHRRLENIDLITIAGPTSSGKTTFSKRLMIQLRVNGIKPIRISTDDYFVERDETPRDEDGNYNFEALEAIDLELFNEHLENLLHGETVQIPSFSFETGSRKTTTTPLQLTGDQLIIIEGIHGLNPDLTPAIDRHRKYLIYVSALTQLVIDDHNRISTSDSRLIRRIVRDTMFRDIPPHTNIERWPSVRRGETEYIVPYQELADSMFNTSLLYELAAIKPYIKSALKQVPRDKVSFRTANRIRRFIDLFRPIDTKEIPPTSILREFIGGSAFNY